MWPISLISPNTSHIGGIAQLVERQLCKLDVWGSNPHASTKSWLHPYTKGPVAQLVRACA